MHPVLRLWEDFLTDRGVLSLPALPRMLYVVRGAVMAGTRPIAQSEAWHGEDAVTVRASEAGATVWRWDLSTGTPGAWRNGPGVISRERLAARLETLPDGDLLWRGDSVAFPPGGIAYLHRHQGPGIRCLVEGELRVDTAGRVAQLSDRRLLVRVGPGAGVRAGRKPPDPFHPRDDPAPRADRQELDPVCQRGRQGETEGAAIPRVRRRAAGAALMDTRSSPRNVGSSSLALDSRLRGIERSQPT